MKLIEQQEAMVLRRSVPVHEYIVDGTVEFTYVLGREIPASVRDEFWKWMRGQTCPVVENDDAAYTHDWYRFLNAKQGKFVLWD